MIGKRFGKLVVVAAKTVSLYGHIIWKVKCDCGKTKIVRSTDLKNAHTKSCGCLIAQNGYKHGLRYTSEYNSWDNMKKRCLSKKADSYPWYGGRGITVCKRWLEFKNFIEDMGLKPTSKHSIDRINVNKNYCPKNCRWSTPKEQNNNQRKRVSK